MSKSALTAANNQQVEALWHVTTDSWVWWDSDGERMCGIRKSEGDAGLQKLQDILGHGRDKHHDNDQSDKNRK